MPWKPDAWVCERGHVIDCGPPNRWSSDTGEAVPSCPVNYRVELDLSHGLYHCQKECRTKAVHISTLPPEYEAAWITGGRYAVTALWEEKTGKRVPT